MSVARSACSRLAVLAALAALLLLPACARASGDAETTPEELESAGVTEIIVKRAPGLDDDARKRLRAGAGVKFEDALPLADTEVVQAETGHLVEALALLRADPDVVYVEPNGPVHAFTADAYWAQQWALHNVGQTLGLPGAQPGLAGADIRAPEAWAAGATGAGQTVAVVDSGVNAAHPDMAGQMATNAGETGGGRERNGVDDDQDGFTDDWRGWDWVAGDNDPDDGFGHGSHVAGIVAARQARRGISGAAPDARVLALRVLDGDGFGSLDAVASAYAYAGDQHVGIVNASLGGTTLSQTEEDAIAQHPQTLYVVAAGNGGADGIGDDNDATPTTYPCAAPEPNIVCVGATDDHDRPASFSNYGATTVDLFAPGVSVLSDWRAPEFGWWYSQGTSMAAPHVAAALALMRAAAPGLSAAELKQALLDSVDPLPALNGLAVSGGRLDAAAAVQRARTMSGSRDTDGDAVADNVDNCPSVRNATQSDGDSDKVGAACDPTPAGPDDDADTAPDGLDNCLFVANADQGDRDADGQGDACDATPDGLDGDGDGVPDMHDNCPAAANADQADADGDGDGDACDATPNGPPPAADPAPVAPAPPAPPTAPAATPLTPVPAAATPAPASAAVTAAPSRTPVATAPSAPVLAALHTGARTPAVTLCATRATRATGCRAKPMTVTFTVDRAVAVTAQVQKRACAHGRCRYVTTATLKLRARAGKNRLTIGARGATARLRPGAYRLRVVAGRSAPRLLAFRVR